MARPKTPPNSRSRHTAPSTPTCSPKTLLFNSPRTPTLTAGPSSSSPSGKSVIFSVNGSDSESESDPPSDPEFNPDLDAMHPTPNVRNSPSLSVRRHSLSTSHVEPKLKDYSIDLNSGVVPVTPDMDVYSKRRAFYSNAIQKIRDVKFPPPPATEGGAEAELPIELDADCQIEVVDNIGLALASASATPEERREADRRHRRLRRKAMRVRREKTRDAEGKLVLRGFGDPETESDELSSTEGEGTSTPTPKGKKRKRSASSSLSAIDRRGRRRPPPGPIPRSTQNQLLPLYDPTVVKPQPIRIAYKRHELGDHSDAWFIEQFRLLYREAEKFVADYFCIHDLKKGTFYEPWAVAHTPEFIYWAEQVAEPDPKTGWDSLLRDGKERKWLVMGVIVRILRMKIFDEELFGTDEREAELMHGVEKTFFLSEGFYRTKLRAEVARSIIGESSVTSQFYPQVAKLTAQIALMLKPLTDYLYSIPPPKGKTLPLASDMYQSLHSLVSRAGYISLCVRLSPTIFHIVDILPGSVYEPDDVYSLEAKTYTVSKERILKGYNYKLSVWQKLKDAAKAEVEAIGAQGRDKTKANQKLAKINNEKPIAPGNVYRALAKIAVWPTVTRFKPGSQEEEDEEATFGVEKKLWEKDGMRLLQICKGAEVCYYGKADRSEKKMRLGKHVREKNKQFGGRGSGSVGKWATGFATAAAVAGGFFAFSNAGSLERIFQFVGA